MASSIFLRSFFTPVLDGFFTFLLLLSSFLLEGGGWEVVVTLFLSCLVGISSLLLFSGCESSAMAYGIVAELVLVACSVLGVGWISMGPTMGF